MNFRKFAIIVLCGLSISSNSLATITVEEVAEINARVKVFFNDEIQHKFGDALQIVSHFKTIPGDASFISGQNYLSAIVINGNLANLKGFSKDGYLMVLCHEIGHSLGGAPMMASRSVEGQSDYFAALKCARRVWRGESANSDYSKTKINPSVREKCTKAYTTKEDFAICIRSAIAAKNLIDTMHEALKRNGKGNLAARPDFDTPDKSVDNLHGHPGLQCRLDTFLAGAYCPLDENEKLSDDDMMQGNCLRSMHALGARPRCWFGNSENP